MIDLMRKYKKSILLGTIVLITPLFVLWGGSFGSLGGQDPRLEDPLGPIAVVGGVAVPHQIFRQALSQELQRRQQYQPDATLADLDADGTAMRVLEQIVNDYVLDLLAQEENLDFDQKLLEDELKKDRRFQKDGQFSPELWNQWVQDNESRNWNAEWERLKQMMRRRAVLERAVASARVLEDEVRAKFEENHTTIRVRYAQVSQPVTPTEEQIVAQYEENPQRYETPAESRAEFVAISMRAPKPALADELVARAREGEDFAELAKEYSEGPYKEQGGDLGWRMQSATTPDYLRALFELEIGEVSDPVEGPRGWYIFTVEETRQSEVTQQTEVKGRQIFLAPELPEDEKAARKAQAEALLAKARESGDLAAAARELGLEVQTTGFFSPQSVTVDAVPPEDGWAFRNALTTLAEGEISEVIEGSRNLYVARIAETKAPELPPLDEVRPQVLADAVAAIERSPEHIAKLRDLAEELVATGESLTQLAGERSDLGLVVIEAEPFTVAEYSYGAGPLWRPEDVLEAVDAVGPGVAAGPVLAFDGSVYLVELIEKTPPSEEVWAEKYEEEKERIQTQLLAAKQAQRLQDFYLERRVAMNWQVNQETYDAVLGLDQPEEDEPTEEAAEGGDVSDADPEATSETEEVEEAPADATPAVEETQEGTAAATAPEAAAPAPETPAAEVAPETPAAEATPETTAAEAVPAIEATPEAPETDAAPEAAAPAADTGEEPVVE